MAKDSKIKAQGSVKKKTTIGENINEVERNEKKQQEFQQNMLRYIDSVVSMGMKHNSKYFIVNVKTFF